MTVPSDQTVRARWPLWCLMVWPVWIVVSAILTSLVWGSLGYRFHWAAFLFVLVVATPVTVAGTFLVGYVSTRGRRPTVAIFLAAQCLVPLVVPVLAGVLTEKNCPVGSSSSRCWSENPDVRYR